MLLCFGTGLTLFAAGMLPFLLPVPAALAQEQPDTTPEVTVQSVPVQIEPVIAVQPTGDNGYCAVCHSQPWRAITLPYGTVLNLYVTPDMIAASVHGDSSTNGKLGCLDCHGNDSFPHNKPTPTDGRTYTLNAVAMCTRCHTQEGIDLASGLHEEAIARGNRKAAVCTDCHGAHEIQPAENQPQLVAGVCGDCHTETLTQWQSSAHVTIGPLGCATCHSQHSQRMRISGNSDATCRNCHTTIPELYVHSTHLISDAGVSCLDCHMFPETQLTTVSGSPVALPNHTMLMDTTPCTTCHQELVDTGKWQQLTGLNSQISAERDALRAQLTQLENNQTALPQDDGGLTRILQGLLVGLGLGITLAVVFFSRGRGGRAN
jgi:formate-dependent nitrite reductase cytochrome c552 subunit